MQQEEFLPAITSHPVPYTHLAVYKRQECGIVGWGEGKNAAGSAGDYAALVHLLNREFGPRLIGRDASQITQIWEDLYRCV